MKNLKKKLIIGCCTLFAVASVAACSGNTEAKDTAADSTAESTNETASEDTQTSSALYGIVTEINENELTLSLGEYAQGKNSGNPGAMDGGTAPSGMPEGDAPSGIPQGESPDGAKDDGTAPSGMPQGDPQNGGQPGGQAPGGMGGAFTESGETLVITIDDESIIKVMNGREETQGSLEDISIDSILAIEYAEDGSLSAVTVQNMGNPNGNADSNSANTVSGDTASTDTSTDTSTENTADTTE